MAHASTGALASFDQIPLGGRLANALVSYLRYAGKTLWPSALAVYYPLPDSWPVWLVICSVFFLVAACCAAVWLGDGRPYVPVGWFWFLGGLFPTIGVVQASTQAMADRFIYFPIIGLLIIIVWGAGELLVRRVSNRAALAVLCSPALVALVVASFIQTGHWRNSVTLFEHNLAVAPDNALARIAIGAALRRDGRLDEARSHLLRALELKPNDWMALATMGNLLAHKRQYAEARQFLERALEAGPGIPLIHRAMIYFDRGVCLEGLGNLDDAFSSFSEAARLNPLYFRAHASMAAVLLSQGKAVEAEDRAWKALSLQPGSASARHDLAAALLMQGRSSEAIEQFSIALSRVSSASQSQWKGGPVKDMIESGDSIPLTARLHSGLGDALAVAGRSGEALANYRRSLEIAPNFAQGRNNLAWFLAAGSEPGLRNGPEAVALAQKAASTEPGNFSFQDTLAAAYAQAGRFSEAVEAIQRAIALAEAAGQTNAASRYRYRLDLYRSNKPCCNP